MNKQQQQQQQPIYGDSVAIQQEDGAVGSLELEHRLLEQRLRQQQKQSEEDSRWLAEEEINLVRLFSFCFSPFLILLSH